MKKSIISAIAFLSLAACMQDEVVSVEHSDAIVFDNAFVENTTRATTSFENKDDLDNFNVWGFINSPEATLFERTEVVKGNNGAWSYAGESRYWIPGHHYYFAAFAPVSANYSVDTFTASDLGLTFTNVDGNEDLIYAESHMVAQESGKNVPVAFQFQHLLSKVRFTFENKMGNEYINVRITDIKVKSAGTASIDLKADPKVWTPQSGKEVTISFGALEKITADNQSSTDDYFVIPSADDYDIEFDVQLEMDGVNGTEILYTAQKKASVPGEALMTGTAYNFSTSITPDIFDFDCISFCVTDVKDWDNATDLSKIAIASKLGGEVTLSGNVEVPGVIEVSRDLVINLNGKTLTFTGTDRMFNVISPAKLTINGVDAEGNAVDGSSVVSTTAACIATANTDAAIVINGGDHQTSGSAAYDTNGGNISISAGRFFNWNPKDFLVGDLIAEPDEDDEQWFVVKEPLKDVWVSNITEFQNALNEQNLNVINVDEDINSNIHFELSNKGNLTINMNTHTYKGDPVWYSANILNNTQLTINDGKFHNGFQVGYTGSNLTLNNCDITVTSTTTNQRYCIFAIDGASVTVNGGAYSLGSQSQRIYFYASAAIIYITDCDCGAASTNTSKYPPIKVANGGQVIITGGRFGFDPTAWVADGYEATQNGSTWTVSKKNE